MKELRKIYFTMKNGEAAVQHAYIERAGMKNKQKTNDILSLSRGRSASENTFFETFLKKISQEASKMF